MAMYFHVHFFPSCGTKCNTACSEVKGTCVTCAQITTGKNKGKWGCVHFSKPPRGTASAKEEMKLTVEDIDKLVHDIFNAHSDISVEQKKRKK